MSVALSEYRINNLIIDVHALATLLIYEVPSASVIRMRIPLLTQTRSSATSPSSKCALTSANYPRST
jgi:hypothetical protein